MWVERIFEAILVAAFIAPALWLLIGVGGFVAAVFMFRSESKPALSLASMILSGLGSLILRKIFVVECYPLNTECKIYHMLAGWGLLFWWLIFAVTISLIVIVRRIRSSRTEG